MDAILNSHYIHYAILVAITILLWDIVFKLNDVAGILRVGYSAKPKETRVSLDDLRRKLEEETSVIGSAMVLIEGLKTKLNEIILNGATAADLRSIVEALDAESKALAEALRANTIAEPAPSPPESLRQ